MSKLKDSHPLKALDKGRDTKGDSEISIPQYITHHIHSNENGHDIIIVSGEQGNERLMKIKCRWPNGKNPRKFPYSHE